MLTVIRFKISPNVPASKETLIAEPNQETKHSSDSFADQVIRRVKIFPVESRGFWGRGRLSVQARLRTLQLSE